jgi:hypothetical protein
MYFLRSEGFPLGPLQPFRRNIHSQNGEDGVIAELVERLGLIGNSARWCVEFGAWDGIHLSNTFALVETRGWNAVYIEADEARFVDLQATAARHPRIRPVRAFVSGNRGDPCSLEAILDLAGIPKDFDLLSIDIDSHDLDVWESLEGYRPGIVVIEINSTFEPGILWRHGGRVPGSSFSSTLGVGRDKGYTLVAHTGNMFFVRDDLFSLTGIDARYVKCPELLFDPAWVRRWDGGAVGAAKHTVAMALRKLIPSRRP